MRISRLLLPVAAALAVAATASAASPPIQNSYLWAQPQTAAVVNPLAQLPAWLQFKQTTFSFRLLPLMLTYYWAQPESAPVHVRYGQPAI